MGSALLSRVAWTALQPSPRLSILIYHRVLSEPDPFRADDPDTRLFERHITTIKRHCRILPLAEAIELLYAGRLPRGAVAITFDDGYADNHANALPILRRHQAHATFFIATGFLNGGWMFNDRLIEAIRRTRREWLDGTDLALGRLPIQALEERVAAVRCVIRAVKHLAPERRTELVERLVDQLGDPERGDSPMMTDRQVLALHQAGMGIGAHTVTHPILHALEEDTARWELTHSRDRLEQLLDAPVVLFAYPNGKPGADYSARETRLLVESGFRAAVCSAPGGAHRGRDRFQLPRYTPDRHKPALFLSQLMRCSREEAAAA